MLKNQKEVYGTIVLHVSKVIDDSCLNLTQSKQDALQQAELALGWGNIDDRLDELDLEDGLGIRVHSAEIEWERVFDEDEG